ncbi:MAG: hypothetical protein ACKVU1_15410 [bacterium]
MLKDNGTAAGANRWRRSGAILCVVLFALAALTLGCGDDDSDNPMDPIDEGPFRRTPEELLNLFETAYNTRDSALFAGLLCEDFQFEFLQADADSLRDILGEDNFWGRTLDLSCTGRLFRSTDVTGIALNILVLSNSPYQGDDCIACRELNATVTLRVSTIGDGTEPLIYAVDSPQTFVTKPDPADSTLWCLFRQIDRPRSLAKRDAATSATAVESKTWGGLKCLFR